MSLCGPATQWELTEGGVGHGLRQAAERLWPSIFKTPAAEARKAELVDKMRAVRPVIETG